MKKKQFGLLLAVTGLFLIMNEPYAFSWIIPFPELTITAVVFLLFLFIFLNSIRGVRKVGLPNNITVALFVTGFVWLFYAIIHADSSYLTRIFLLLITYFLLLILYRTGEVYRFWIVNNRFVLIQTILSTICFVLVGIGLLKPLLVINAFDGSGREFFFWGGCFSKTYIGNLIRPSGFFDEPGALASWAIYGLMLNYAFLKDHLTDKYTPYFAASTLSVAYFIQLAIYLGLKNIKKAYRLIPIVALLFLAIGFINKTKDTEFDLYARTIARFEYDEESGIAGNSRQHSLENAKKVFLQNPIFGVGGKQFSESQEGVSDNPYEILAKDGFVGFLVSYLPLLLVFVVNRRKEVVVALIVITVGYLQRPLHINFVHDLYIWGFLLLAIIDAKERRVSVNKAHPVLQ